ncbi:MAG: Crp/Fnr family transcriptional regulator [Candidatus Bipolaricaulota bacterium]
MLSAFDCGNRREQQELEEITTEVEYQRGDTVFQQGAPGLGLYFVFEGKVKLVHRTSQAKSFMFKIAGPGDMIGLPVLFSKTTYSSYAETLSPSRIGFLKKDDFFEFLREYPSMMFQCCDWLSEELITFRLKLVEASYAGSKQRICRLLTQLENETLESRNIRNILAQLTGVSYKTVIQVLKELEEREFIRMEKNNVWVEDVQSLRRIAKDFPLELSLKAMI